MSLNASRFSASIRSYIVANVGSEGSQMQNFCDSVANGSINHILGKAFTTTDTGMITGAGAGMGTGITGLVKADVSDLIYNEAESLFGQAGPKLREFCDGLAEALIDELGQATLTSSHTPVFTGSGQVDVGSIAVDPTTWGAMIYAEGLGKQMLGSQWQNFANAIGKGFADSVLNAGTGTVTISGSPVTPPPPTPGAGVGSGSIS
jgi:hypothetical protein